MMNLFRSLADAGKTVVCITHSLANVERTCHLVVILTAGGKLAFVGKPAEALEYFGIDRLGDVYDRLPNSRPSTGSRHSSQPVVKRYVASECRDRRQAAGRCRPRARIAPSRRGCPPSDGPADAPIRRHLARRLPVAAGDGGPGLLVAVLLGLLFGDLTTGNGQLDLKGIEHAQQSVNLMFLLGGVELLVRLQQRRQGNRQGAHHLHARARLQSPRGQLLRLEIAAADDVQRLQALLLAAVSSLVPSARIVRRRMGVLPAWRWPA